MKPNSDMSIHKVNLWWNLSDEMSIHNANFWWNLPVKCLYIKWNYITLHNAPNKISKNICLYKVNLWWNLPVKCQYIKWIFSAPTSEMSIHKANLLWNQPVKCLYIMRICGETYHKANLYQIKYQKIYLCLLATIINTLKKNPQNSSLKTQPQVNKKGEAIVYSVQ